MNLTPEEQDEYQRTGRLPAREQERIAREGIERTRESNERAANRDPRKDPTLRDSVYLPSDSPPSRLEAYEKALIRIRDERIAMTSGREPTSDQWEPMSGWAASALAAEVLASAPIETSDENELRYLRAVEQAARTFCGPSYHRNSLATLKRLLDERDEMLR